MGGEFGGSGWILSDIALDIETGLTFSFSVIPIWLPTTVSDVGGSVSSGYVDAAESLERALSTESRGG